MRAVVLACTLAAGCGRFGFEARTGNDATAPDDGDGHIADGTPLSCSATKVADYTLPAGVTELAAAAMPDGYAIGALVGQSGLYGVHLDTGLVPNAMAPFQTSPVPFNAYAYNAATLWFDGTNLDGAVWLLDGSMYLKTYQPDMMQFLTATQKSGRHGEPSVAHAGTATISTWWSALGARFNALQADGTPAATDYTASSVTNIVNASTVSGPSAMMVTEAPGGICDAIGIGSDFSATSVAFSSPCKRPYGHTNNVDTVFVYEANGVIATRSVSATAPPVTVTVSGERLLVPGTDARLLQTDRRWLVWLDSNALHVGALAAPVDVPISGVPAGVPAAFEIAGRYVFAVWGTDLYAITCT